jgi:hypothetical protein
MLANPLPEPALPRYDCYRRQTAAALLPSPCQAAAIRHGLKICQKCAWQKINDANKANKTNKAKRRMRNRMSYAR